jgi:hypothetical protein
MAWTPGGGADGNVGRWVGGAGDEQLVSTQLEQEQRLAAKATRIYFGYDLVMGRKMQPEQARELEQLLAECTYVSGLLPVSLLSTLGPTLGWCSTNFWCCTHGNSPCGKCAGRQLFQFCSRETLLFCTQ